MLRVRGYVCIFPSSLHHPFFGGSERTGSELKMMKDPILPLSGSDHLWELSLPVGADRDHEYCNLNSGIGLNKCEPIREMGFRTFISG